MKFSIITPTVQRNSLRKCCESVATQTYRDYQHIIMIDGNNQLDTILLEDCFDLRQNWFTTGRCCRNGGNTPRHLAWQKATGEWVYHLDDDNFFSSPYALQNIAEALEGIKEDWAIFPIFRHGSVFYFDPPQPCYFDTGNAIARREIAQWPDIDGYASDAVWMEGMKKHGPYKAFPDMPPVMVMPGTSFGAGGGINGQ